MFPLSWTQALFVGEPLDASLERLARYGYDGVELPVLDMPPKEVNRRLVHFGLACLSVNGSFIGMSRDLSSADEASRLRAVEYVASCMRFAAAVGATIVIVVPTRIGKLRPETTIAEEWTCAARSLREIGELGAQLGITAVIECVNRAETYLVNSLDTARRLVETSGSEHVGVMADSFHMNIEEVDMIAALEAVAPWLRHVHLADNNRMVPGMGHLDLAPFVATLHRIGYRGSLTMECDAQTLDDRGRYMSSASPAVFDRFAATAIETLRRINSMNLQKAEKAGEE